MSSFTAQKVTGRTREYNLKATASTCAELTRYLCIHLDVAARHTVKSEEARRSSFGMRQAPRPLSPALLPPLLLPLLLPLLPLLPSPPPAEAPRSSKSCSPRSLCGVEATTTPPCISCSTCTPLVSV